jgi:hypothetical protein
MEKLLNNFFIENPFNQRQIWAHFWYFWKAVGYNEGDLDFKNLRCGSY